jgi:hypothetical protein
MSWICGELLSGLLGLLEKGAENVVEIEKDAGNVLGQFTLLKIGRERATAMGALFQTSSVRTI